MVPRQSQSYMYISNAEGAGRRRHLHVGYSSISVLQYEGLCTIMIAMGTTGEYPGDNAPFIVIQQVNKFVIQCVIHCWQNVY